MIVWRWKKIVADSCLFSLPKSILSRHTEIGEPAHYITENWWSQKAGRAFGRKNNIGRNARPTASDDKALLFCRLQIEETLPPVSCQIRHLLNVFFGVEFLACCIA